jgi:hypothetical protein
MTPALEGTKRVDASMSRAIGAPNVFPNILKISSLYLTGNTLRLRYKAQPVNAV